MTQTIKDGAPFVAIYLAAFFFALSGSVPLYVNSSFLGQFLPESLIGFAYSISSLLLLFLLPQLPKILTRWGNYSATLFIFGLTALAFLGLSIAPYALVALALFIATQTLLSLGFFNFDVFLEAFSSNAKTGTIRGFMLTIVNIAVFLGPLLAGMILTDSDFWKIYLVAPFFLVGAIFLIARNLKTFKDPAYRAITFWKTLRNALLARHPHDTIRHALIGDFLLRFFYAWMVIYTPLYLSRYVGFEWSDIGIIIAIALVPFMLFEFPIGKLLDKVFKEKYVMALGFAIAASFTMALFFVESTSLLVWAGLLFGTRVGASFIEISSESYFFKHISTVDTTILSVFRNTQPLAYIVAPSIASALLVTVSFEYLFLALGLFLCLGIVNSFLIPHISKKS